MWPTKNSRMQRGGDCALYGDMPSAFVDLKPGEFLIVYPEDPHAPLIGTGEDSQAHLRR